MLPFSTCILTFSDSTALDTEWGTRDHTNIEMEIMDTDEKLMSAFDSDVLLYILCPNYGSQLSELVKDTDTTERIE